jgi:hypothetical protein
MKLKLWKEEIGVYGFVVTSGSMTFVTRFMRNAQLFQTLLGA